MEQILQVADHEDHDQTWCFHLPLNNIHICIACIVQIVEDNTRLIVQKKLAISQLLTVTSEHSDNLRVLFNHSGQVTQHILFVLINQFSADNEAYVLMALEVCMRIVLLMKSDDLLYFVVDCIKSKLGTNCNREEQKVCFVLLGRLLNVIPTLGNKLLHENIDVLKHLIDGLKDGTDEMKTSVVYALVYLPEEAFYTFLPSTYMFQIMQSTLCILSDSTCSGLQVNTLGLLKKLLSSRDVSEGLMKLNINGITLQSTMKKLLISKKDVLQIGTAQCISHFLSQQANCQNAKCLLEFDLAEFLFEALHTRNGTQLEVLIECLLLMSREEEFYTRCHSVYGIDAIIRAVDICFEIKNHQLLCKANSLLSVILERQPLNIPLFISRQSVEQCLDIIQKGVASPDQDVFKSSTLVFKHLLKKEYFHLPVQFDLLQNILEDIRKHYVEFYSTSESEKHKKMTAIHCKKPKSPEEILILLHVTDAGLRLFKSCQKDPIAHQEVFSAPSCETFSVLNNFGDYLTNIIEETCMPLVMAQWNCSENKILQCKILEILNHLYDIHEENLFPFFVKITKAGFILEIIQLKTRSQETGGIVHELLWKFCQCLLPKHFPGLEVPSWLENGLLNLTDSIFDTVQHSQTSPIYEDTLFAFLLIGYLNCMCKFEYFESDEELDLITTWILKSGAILSDTFVLKPLIFFLAKLNSNDFEITMDVSSRICKSAQNIQVEKWYTHNPVLIRLGFSNSLLEKGIGWQILQEWLLHTSDVGENIEGSNDDWICEQTVFCELMSSYSFLDCLIGFLGNSLQEIRQKAKEIIEEHIGDEKMNLYTVKNLVLEHLQKMFLKDSSVGDYHLKYLLEIWYMLQSKSSLPTSAKDIKIAYHVIKYLSLEENLTPEIVSYCLGYLSNHFTEDATSESSVQIAAIILQNQKFIRSLNSMLKSEADHVFSSALKLTVGLVRHCDDSLKVKDTLHIYFQIILNKLMSDDSNTVSAVLEFIAVIFQNCLKIPFIRFFQQDSQFSMPVSQISKNDLRRLFIFLQQRILQVPYESKNLPVKCMDALLTFMETTGMNDDVIQLLSQPSNLLFLDLITRNLQAKELHGCCLEFIKMMMLNEGRRNVLTPCHIQAMCDSIINISTDDNNPELIKNILNLIISNKQDDLPKELKETLSEKLEVLELLSTT